MVAPLAIRSQPLRIKRPDGATPAIVFAAEPARTVIAVAPGVPSSELATARKLPLIRFWLTAVLFRNAAEPDVACPMTPAPGPVPEFKVRPASIWVNNGE